MSLWYKEAESIGFSDIDVFCLQGYAEGLRLDYKVQIPSGLEKWWRLSPNTLGGLIILGVEAAKKTNKTSVPAAGDAEGVGIEEKVTAICRDNIYPPVRPQISGIIDNPHDPGTVLGDAESRGKPRGAACCQWF